MLQTWFLIPKLLESSYAWATPRWNRGNVVRKVREGVNISFISRSPTTVADETTERDIWGRGDRDKTVKNVVFNCGQTLKSGVVTH